MRTENIRQASPIRLAQVIYALCLGGSEILAWRIARSLNRTGRYVGSLCAVDHGGPLAEMLAADGIPSRAYSRTGRLDLKLIGQMARQFRADKIQLVHTHHIGQLLYGGIAGRLAGARVVHTEHDIHSLGRPRTQRLLRVLSGMVDVVTTVAQPVTEFLRDTVRIPSRKLKTIPNGVDIAAYRSAVPISRSVLGWRDEDVIIGCIARLEPEKGHAVLLDAFRRIHTRQPFARLLLIGDGSEREKLQSMAHQLGLNGSVRFLGVRTDIPELLATCDLTTLASAREGLPMAILEAMAAGRPVVATRVGSVSELVRDEETGLLIPPGDPEALAEALQTMIADSRKRQQFAAKAFEVVRARYSFDRTLEQYDSLYTAVLSTQNPESGAR